MEISRSQFIRQGLPAAAGLCLATSASASASGGTGAPEAPGATRGGGAHLRFAPIELHLRHAWTLSRNTSTVKRNYVVELSCDGIVGLGEAAPNVRFHESAQTVERALQVAAEIVSQVHPSHRVELTRRLSARLPDDHAARCAVDMALWDWNGKALSAPLFRLLGLDPHAAPQTSFSIAIADKQELIQKVREAAPFPLLKVKLGGKGPGVLADREIIDTIHGAAPDKRLRVDPNEGWTPDEARDKLRWLAQLRLPGGPLIELCEQPLPAADLPALRSLYQDPKRPRDLPLLLDESVLFARDIPGLAGACDGAVVKLQKAGGVSGALDQITVLRALGLKVMLGCMIESSIGITAAAHLAPLCDYVDLDGNLLVADDPYRGVEVSGGRLVLPGGPGLGVTGIVRIPGQR